MPSPRHLLAMLFLLTLQCLPEPNPIPPTTRDDCVQACHHLQVLDCDLAKPTSDGASCLSWCNEFRQSPAGVDPKCLARVRSCDQTDECGS